MEDSIFAGALVEGLQGNCKVTTDSSRMVQVLYQQGKDNLYEFLENSSHVNRLKKLGLDKDIEFCLKMDKYNVLPVLKNMHLIKMGLNDMLV